MVCDGRGCEVIHQNGIEDVLWTLTPEEQRQEDAVLRALQARQGSAPAWCPPPGGDAWRGIPAMDAVPPAPEALLTGFGGVTGGGLTLLSAASKARKSWLLQELAVGVASGVGWQGYACPRPRRVVLLDLEILPHYLARRLHGIRRAIEAPGDVLDEHLTVLPWRGFYESHKFGDRIWQEATGRIEEAQPDLIIADPVYCLLAGADENDHHTIHHLLSQLRQLGETTGAAVVISHHHAKGTTAERSVVDRAAGSGVWGRFPDSIITLTGVHPARLASGGLDAIAGAQVVEAVVRNEAPIPPWLTMWQEGVMRRQDPAVWSRAGVAGVTDLLLPPPRLKAATEPKSVKSVKGVRRKKGPPEEDVEPPAVGDMFPSITQAEHAAFYKNVLAHFEGDKTKLEAYFTGWVPSGKGVFEG